MKVERTQVGSGFWLQWVLASTVGVTIGWTLGARMGALYLFSVPSGILIGIMQWLVLRRYASGAGWWLLATAAAWPVSGFVALPLGGGTGAGQTSVAMAGVVFGALVGISQWLVLRRQTSQAGWWVLVSAAGWSAGWVAMWALFEAARGFSGGDMSTAATVLAQAASGAVAGAVTGIALVWLLRYPLPKERTTTPKKQLFWVWVLASTAGWCVGWAVVGGIVSAIVGGAAVSSGAVAGTMVGIIQWLVLRQHISRAGWWILVSAAGWSAGWIVSAPIGWSVGWLIGWAVGGAALGAIVGTGQWLILSRHMSRAGWWVLASVVGWSLGWPVDWLVRGAAGDPAFGVAFGALATAVATALTGLALVWLLRDSLPDRAAPLKSKQVGAVVGLLSLTVVILFMTRSLPVTYRGLTLPAPTPVRAGLPLAPPPPAWLIIGEDQAIAGTVVDFGRPGIFRLPALIGDLATASLPADAPATVVVGSEPFQEFRAMVRPWGGELDLFCPGAVTSARELKAEAQREGPLTVFTLEPIGDAGDQLLVIQVTFSRQLDCASYIWRLNVEPQPPTVGPTAEPTQREDGFRSAPFHPEVTLPPGWAAAEGPEQLARPFTGLVAFNSWNEPRFWAPQVTTEGSSIYSPGSVLGQMPDDGAYIVLIHFSGGPPPEQYGPEYEPQDLGGLWKEADCRKRGATYFDFFKWGRFLRLEVYCGPRASDETAAAVNELLASWRFDRAPVGDIGWAVIAARQLLPPSVEPARFPIVSEGPSHSSIQNGSNVWITQAQVQEETVVVTFMYRWDEPPAGSDSDDCPLERCHWWKFEARPSGEVALVEEGGATLPGGGQ